MRSIKTQVCIVGGGPAGMMLSHILHCAGIDSIVLERQSKAYILSRIRAGVLEHGSVEMLREHGLNERMDRDGKAKDGTRIVWEGRSEFFIDTARWTGKQLMAYGQTNITEDLYAARERDGGNIVTQASNVALHEITNSPYVALRKGWSNLPCRM